MPTVGALIIEMRANSAQFTAELDKTRKGLKSTGTEFGLTQRQATNFAAQGLEKIVDISPRLGNALGDLANQSKNLGRAINAVGFAVFAKDAFDLGVAIGENIRNLIDYGTVWEFVREKIEKAQTEERKFQDAMKKGGELRRSLAAKLAGLEDEGAVAVLRLAGAGTRPAGAPDFAILEGEFQQRLNQIERLRMAERDKIVGMGLLEKDRIQATVLVDRNATQERINAGLEFAKKTKDLKDNIARSEIELQERLTSETLRANQDVLGAIEAERLARNRSITETIENIEIRERAIRLSNTRAAGDSTQFLADQKEKARKHAKEVRQIQEQAAERQFDLWKTETQFLLAQLKERFEARRTFEAQLGQGGEGLGVQTAAGGLRRIAEARESFRKGLRDTAFLEREGGLPGPEVAFERERLVEGFRKTIGGIKSEFSSIRPVIEAANRALDLVSMQGFITEVRNARDWVNHFIDSEQQLIARTGDVAKALLAAVPATQQHAAEIRKLSTEYNTLAWQIFEATKQQSRFNDVGAGSGGVTVFLPAQKTIQ